MSDCNQSVPKLSIAILVVGTRGDVQPFLAVARKLQEYGHCVRLATHSEFSGLVKSAGVDFYPLGGDPRVIVEGFTYVFMSIAISYLFHTCYELNLTIGFIKTQNILLTSWQDIATQLKQLMAVMESLLEACTHPDPITGDSFRAQAIIANPPAYGRVDVAEALGVPLHIFFTVPWTPTCAFPHPFIPHISHRAGYWLSYVIVDILIWWGLRGHLNKLRKNKLNLSPINGLLDTNQVSISHLPTTYMWSPRVLPKPNDWGPLVDIVGYCFVDLGIKYEPPQELVEWMQKGVAPIYIGFGSMPLKNPENTTNIVLEALKNTGQRGIVDRGWGGLATHAQDVAENIFLLSTDCPHDWLFPQCCAVVHHGGAGTTAAGLKAGCPTTIVPFCGDQSLWGAIIYERGVGPAPIPIAHLSVESLSKAMRFMLQPEVKSRAVDVAISVRDDDGAAAALDSFHRHLPLPNLEQGDQVQTIFGYLARFCCLFCAS
ncbi:sterol 3-beta-glucosyltransferase UGT80B1-like isoform X2 [Salvia splendens]|uniref:sterol 3-beta-glucosyltransferase UGT80B1-like isoform X2 n=1 Tax=Salvia splendens TaxID=180675 RepID=UPI001C26A1DB|nr:sterol 3-beta-glucosyltransferase UGT80B1-like isoform X2 [Salvia splendens]